MTKLYGVLCSCALIAVSSLATAADWTLVSTRTDGSLIPEGVNWSLDDYGDRRVSDDGLRIIFQTKDATIIAPGAGPEKRVVKDLSTGVLELVDVLDGCLSGTPKYVAGSTMWPAISGGGSEAVFRISVSKLAELDCSAPVTNTTGDLLLTTGPIILTPVAVKIPGGQSGYGSNNRALLGLSANYMAFETTDTLITGEPYSSSKYLIYTLSGGVYERISVGYDGSTPNGASTLFDITDDGRFVLFLSAASNLIANDTNAYYDIFLVDRLSQTTTRINETASGGQVGAYISYSRARVTADGEEVIFGSSANNLVPNDLNGTGLDIFVKNRLSGAIERFVMGAGTGDESRWTVYLQDVSKNGEYVLFYGHCTHQNCSAKSGLYVWHRATGVVSEQLVTRFSGDNPNGRLARISGDGSRIFYVTGRADLSVADDNGMPDIYTVVNPFFPQ